MEDERKPPHQSSLLEEDVPPCDEPPSEKGFLTGWHPERFTKKVQMVPKNLDKKVTRSQLGNQSLQFQRVIYSDTVSATISKVEAPQVFMKENKVLENTKNLQTEKHRYFLQSMVQRAEILARPLEEIHSVSRLERAKSIDWIQSKTLGLGGYFPMRNIVKQSYKALSRGVDNSLYLSKEVMMKEPIQEDRISIQKEKRLDSRQRQQKSMSNILS